MQGAESGQTESLARGELDDAELTVSDQVLLQFAKRLTEEPAKTEASDIEALRAAGWTDEQIAEAVYVIAMFAFFNRVADAFGLTDPAYGQLENGRGVTPATSYTPSSGD